MLQYKLGGLSEKRQEKAAVAPVINPDNIPSFNQLNIMRNKNTRISREGNTVAVMIALYCHKHHFAGGLCAQCKELLEYANERLEKCPFGEDKTTCAKCPVHCYKPEMRQKIRAVMRYSGPCMIYKHPIMAIRHFMDGRRKEPLPVTKE